MAFNVVVGAAWGRARCLSAGTYGGQAVERAPRTTATSTEKNAN
ncbi:hypothetical protein GCM10018785_04890 [Streptomyces longispororuber]|uniref:Uncharacterized protein n=1 Tax=Streptomyces longispororuber TaxID=68230 RepID=A0A919DFL5_9ACTN|nr:hypothetical protein GCM10018785_04890 [Streptomyces longispororuber]